MRTVFHTYQKVTNTLAVISNPRYRARLEMMFVSVSVRSSLVYYRLNAVSAGDIIYKLGNQHNKG